MVIGVSVQIQFSEDGTFIKLNDMGIVGQGLWSTSDVWVMFFGQSVCFTFVMTSLGDEWHSFSATPWLNLQLSTGPLETPNVEVYTFIAPTPTAESRLGMVKTLYR